MPPETESDAARWLGQAREECAQPGTLAAYDLFRRFSQGLTQADLAALVTSGLLAPGLFQAGLDQRMPAPDPRLLAGLLRGAGQAPELAARLAPVAGRMTALRALYARFPRDPGRFGLWRRARDRLLTL